MSSILNHFISLSAQDKDAFIKDLGAQTESNKAGASVRFLGEQPKRSGRAYLIKEAITHNCWPVFEELFPDFLHIELKEIDKKNLVDVFRHMFIGNHVEAVQRASVIIDQPSIQEIIKKEGSLRTSQWCLPYLYHAFPYMDVAQLAQPLLNHTKAPTMIDLWKKQFSFETQTVDDRLGVLLLEKIYDNQSKPFYLANMLFNCIEILNPKSKQLEFLVHHVKIDDLILMGPNEYEYGPDETWAQFMQGNHRLNLDLDLMRGYEPLYLKPGNRKIAIKRLSLTLQLYEKHGLNFDLSVYTGIKKLLDNVSETEIPSEWQWLSSTYERHYIEKSLPENNNLGNKKKM